MPTEAAGVTRVVVEGSVERFVYRSRDGRYGIARVRIPGREPVTVVGLFFGIGVGVQVRVTAREENDPRFGPQLRAESVLPIVPTTSEGLRRYIGSGVVPGVGPAIAERIIERFGTEAVDVLEREPERLREIKGIGPRRAARLAEVWAEQRGIRDVMVFLEGCGISPALATRIYREHGAESIARVRQNPYSLTEVRGVGFMTADRIARNMGISADSPLRAVAGIVHLLEEAASEGHVFLPRTEIVEMAARRLEIDANLASSAIAEATRQRKLVCDCGTAIYLPDLHAAEVAAAAGLARLLRAPPRAQVGGGAALVDAYQRRAGIDLADPQRAAIERALTAPLLVITGGPGVGKTTIVRGAVELLVASGARVALAAPTGRAAKRLAEATGANARTIHRLLEWSPQEGRFLRGSGNPLPVDVVIVDEASMVDLPLFARLVAALSDGMRLILVGDADQLPSVGAGAVLRDILESGIAEVVRLSQIFRQQPGSRLIANAHRINLGEAPQLDAADDFFFIERDDPEAALATVVEVVAERIPRRFGLDRVRDIQVLVPMRRGAVGAHRLNLALQDRLNPGAAVGPGSMLRVGDKVMQLRNDYERDVWNGDVGQVVGRDEEAGQVLVRFDDRAVGYDAQALDDLALAYATTIHKAQGSEYPAVVLPLVTQHYLLLRRALLYTAVTRAKRLCVIVGSRRALRLAIANAREESRHSSLVERLRA